LSTQGSNHGSTGNDVARWLFYLMWLSLSYLILRSLSLSLLFNVARSLFYLLGYLDISVFDVSPMGAYKLRNCKMSKCNCRAFDPSCRYRPPYLRTSVPPYPTVLLPSPYYPRGVLAYNCLFLLSLPKALSISPGRKLTVISSLAVKTNGLMIWL